MAQSTRSELTGIVRDPTGAPVNGALLEVRNVGTGLVQTQTTHSDGAYEFPALPPGKWNLSVSRTGFLTLRRDAIALRVAERRQLDLDLTLGDTSQTIDITAAPPLLQAARGTVSFSVEQQRVVTLPLDGRNFVPLIALSPGVNLPPGNLFPRINGSRPRQRVHL